LDKRAIPEYRTADGIGGRGLIDAEAVERPQRSIFGLLAGID
jgi:hypothetical protein